MLLTLKDVQLSAIRRCLHDEIGPLRIGSHS